MSVVKEYDWIAIASSYLKNLAKQIYRNLAENRQIDTWELFKEAMNRSYQAADLQSKLRRKLENLRQTGTYKEYESKFTEIMNQIR